MQKFEQAVALASISASPSPRSLPTSCRYSSPDQGSYRDALPPGHNRERCGRRPCLFEYLAFKSTLPSFGPEHSRNDLDSGRFAGTIRSQKANDLAGRELETDILNEQECHGNFSKGFVTQA